MKRARALLACAVLAFLPPLEADVSAVRPGGSVRTSAAVVSFRAGVRATRAQIVAHEVEYVRGRIGRDFGRRPGALRVLLLPTHSAFARALWRLQGARPQGTDDDSGAVVRGLLLLGPEDDPYLRHNLAHVYTEWVMDGLSGNGSDALPNGTWLYDGLAEYEALKYAPAGVECRVRARPPFDVAHLNTPQRWMAMRAGPFGSLAYCLASMKVQAVVERIGLRNLVEALHGTVSWGRLAARLAGMLESSPAR